jgi:hypothetical protein
VMCIPWFYSWLFNRYWSITLRAIGAATEPPLPPFSTITATAILGSSTGAKPTNNAWSRSFFFIFSSSYSSSCLIPNTCAVPVFPAIL